MKKPERFLIIDDDPLNNVLCKMVIRRMYGDVKIKLFNRPNLALESIKEEYGKADANISTILFLDINMPYMSGWEFLREFEDFSYHIQKQFSIYILTSSIDENDRKRAAAEPIILDFLSKPLSVEMLTKIAQGERSPQFQRH